MEERIKVIEEQLVAREKEMLGKVGNFKGGMKIWLIFVLT